MPFPLLPIELHPLVNVARRRCIARGGAWWGSTTHSKETSSKLGGSLGTAPVRGKLRGHVKGGVIFVFDICSVFGIFHGALPSHRFQKNPHLENNGVKQSSKTSGWRKVPRSSNGGWLPGSGWVAWILQESPIC